MPLTRSQASALLSSTEMGLYDASRANAVRGHTPAKLAQLVTRARKSRDRARDLEQRQKLALRAKTGSKGGRTGKANARSGEKAELLGDILSRFEAQQRSAKNAATAGAKKAGTKRAGSTAAKKGAAAKRPAAKQATRKQASGSKTGSAARTGTRAATKKSAAKGSVRKSAAKVPARKSAAKGAAKKSPAGNAAKKSKGRQGSGNNTAARKRGAAPTSTR